MIETEHLTKQFGPLTAVNDLNLRIEQGEFFAFLGPNAAGKTTTIKLLAGLLRPTSGRAIIGGYDIQQEPTRARRLISYVPDFPFLYDKLQPMEFMLLVGQLYGMTRAEIVRKFDEIVAFSEIEEFLDTPVKHYSSGMYVRLAFAVAAHLDPEILIVDEVLAVGDAAFQRKCLGKMGSFAQSGRTVLFVSHNMEAVRSLCQRGVWLKEGRVHEDGKADEIVEAYFNSISNESSFSCANLDYGLTIRKVVLRNDKGKESSQFRPGDDLVVEISYDAQKRIEKPIIALGVLGINGSCFTSNMLLDGHRPDSLQGAGKITCTFRSIPLLPQNYTVKLIVRAANVKDQIIRYQEVAYFNVVGDLAEYGYKGEFLTNARYSTPVVVPYEWRLPDGTTVAVALSRPAPDGAVDISPKVRGSHP